MKIRNALVSILCLLLLLFEIPTAHAYVPVEIHLHNGLILKGGNGNYKGLPLPQKRRRTLRSENVLGVLITSAGTWVSMSMTTSEGTEQIEQVLFDSLDDFNRQYAGTAWEVTAFSTLTVDNNSAQSVLRKFLLDVSIVINKTVRQAADPEDYGPLADHIEVTPDGEVYFVLGFGKISAAAGRENVEDVIDHHEILGIGRMPDMPSNYLGKASVCEKLLNRRP